MDTARKKRIGFVGLGLMGSGMARSLLSAGFPRVGIISFYEDLAGLQ